MRKRLTELIMECRTYTYEYEPLARVHAEYLAQHLLNNGIIVMPCKVGDTVYILKKCSCENIDGRYTECEFYGYGLNDRLCTIPEGKKCPYIYRVMAAYVTEHNLLMFAKQWNKTVFASQAEAEKAVAQMNKEGER